MKGIILAAGRGTRLYPMTKPVCKPLLPVYDKPMIYYPLAVLLQAGIRDIMIITPPDDGLSAFERLLGDGSTFGVKISYAVQTVAKGIADALLIGEDFIAGDNVCLVLGDNIFYSPTFQRQLDEAMSRTEGATVFGCWSDNPSAFGVVEFDDEGNVLSLEEKPSNPKSNYIVPGLYFYDSQCIELAKQLKPSARGELEITDLNIAYMKKKQLHVTLLDKEFIWLDAGTEDNLLEAATVVQRTQKKLYDCIGCLEVMAMEAGLITPEQCSESGLEMEKTLYGKHILRKVKAKLEQEPELKGANS